MRRWLALLLPLLLLCGTLLFGGCECIQCCYCTCKGGSCTGKSKVSSSSCLDCESRCKEACTKAKCPYESGRACLKDDCTLSSGDC